MLLSLLRKIPEKPRNRLLKSVAILVLVDLALWLAAFLLVWQNKSENIVLHDIADVMIIAAKICLGIVAAFFLAVTVITFIDEFKTNGMKYLSRKAAYFCVCYAVIIICHYLAYRNWIFIDGSIVSLLLVLLPVAKRGTDVLNQYNLSIYKKQEQNTVQ